jgi:hypothetical protein
MGAEILPDARHHGGRPFQDGGRPSQDGGRPSQDGGRPSQDGGRPSQDTGPMKMAPTSVLAMMARTDDELCGTLTVAWPTCAFAETW